MAFRCWHVEPRTMWQLAALAVLSVLVVIAGIGACIPSNTSTEHTVGSDSVDSGEVVPASTAVVDECRAVLSGGNIVDAPTAATLPAGSRTVPSPGGDADNRTVVVRRGSAIRSRDSVIREIDGLGPADVPPELSEAFSLFLQNAPENAKQRRVLFLGDSIMRGQFIASALVAAELAVESPAEFPVPDGWSAEGEDFANLPFTGKKVEHADWPTTERSRAVTPVALGYDNIAYFGEDAITPVLVNSIEQFRPSIIVVGRGAWDAVWGDSDAVSAAGAFCANVSRGLMKLRRVAPDALLVAVAPGPLYPGKRGERLKRRCSMALRLRVFREAMRCACERFNRGMAHESASGPASQLPSLFGQRRALLIDWNSFARRFPLTATPDGVHLLFAFESLTTALLYDTIVAAEANATSATNAVVPSSRCFETRVLSQVWRPDASCVQGDLDRERRAYDAVIRALRQQPHQSLAQCAPLLATALDVHPEDRWVLELPEAQEAIDNCEAVVARLARPDGRSANASTVQVEFVAMRELFDAFQVSCTSVTRLLRALQDRVRRPFGAQVPCYQAAAALLARLHNGEAPLCDPQRLTREGEVERLREAWKPAYLTTVFVWVGQSTRSCEEFVATSRSVARLCGSFGTVLLEAGGNNVTVKTAVEMCEAVLRRSFLQRFHAGVRIAAVVAFGLSVVSVLLCGSRKTRSQRFADLQSKSNA